MIRGLVILHWVVAILIAETLVYALYLLVGGNGDHTLFSVGLALIGVSMALLGIPISLKITRPLDRLETAALRMAGGDLSARAHLAGKHIIGRRLAEAFNLMAEKVERMVRGGKELTANMSHELRSPLTRIRIAGECLSGALERGDTEEARQMLGAMWDDIEEADRMIGRILEYSKIDLVEHANTSDEVMPAELMKRVAAALGPLARAKGIELRLDLDEKLRTAGDAEGLRSVFNNVMENALRYTPQGGVVEVAAQGAAGKLEIIVTNTSDPLEPDDLEAIFTPFYRGRNATSEGSGLGLSIVRKIIELHHGDVLACNVPEGFQIRIRLPLSG
ncbi:sensor histidine kinase [Geomonas ferrireducens]|uniref:sensor histidine kinase n=1 Tax=Geomonas ferrireducens TaxID=2570227 RepID=UPI0010A81991|nr:HAMP domain-containing sensor histidine kinase [Geomonas ferrireducens]